jgi:hypothetical protein
MTLSNEDKALIKETSDLLKQLKPLLNKVDKFICEPIDTTEGEPIETEQRWQPSYGVKYWYIGIYDGQFFVVDFHWVNDDVDFVNHDTGNCFKSREAAQKAAEAIKQYLSTNKF